jgi:hypothetical protein
MSMMSFGANCALSQQKTGGLSNLTSQISRAGLDNFNNGCMMYFSSLSLGYYKLLRILLDSYQVLDDPGSN